jgi:hypothetical protein
VRTNSSNNADNAAIAAIRRIKNVEPSRDSDNAGLPHHDLQPTKTSLLGVKTATSSSIIVH